MKFAKRLLMVAGAVALAGLFGVMLAPKAVHAVVSTLVTVSNTSTNPVPTVSTDASQAFVQGGSCSLVGTNFCGASVLTVPSGDTAVIESFSGECTVDQDTVTVLPSIVVTNGSQIATTYFPNAPVFRGPDISAEYYATWAQNFKTYALAGSGVVVTIGVSPLQSSSGISACSVIIAGRLVPTP
jgi:hypothetical protein